MAKTVVILGVLAVAITLKPPVICPIKLRQNTRTLSGTSRIRYFAMLKLISSAFGVGAANDRNFSAEIYIAFTDHLCRNIGRFWVILLPSESAAGLRRRAERMNVATNEPCVRANNEVRVLRWQAQDRL